MNLVRNHTPGPWRFDEKDFKIKGTDDANFYTVIANTSPKMNYARGSGTCYCNSILIASAPEMYELLHRLLKDWHNSDDLNLEDFKEIQSLLKRIDY